MVKMTLITILCFFFRTLTAPPRQEFPILKTDAIYFDPILTAFKSVESSFRTTIVNHLGFTGILQIGPEMVKEVNRICILTGDKARFKFPESALNPVESIQIWYKIQQYWNPGYSLSRCAKIWNPKADKRYLQRIKKAL